MRRLHWVLNFEPLVLNFEPLVLDFEPMVLDFEPIAEAPCIYLSFIASDLTLHWVFIEVALLTLRIPRNGFCGISILCRGL
jgi:hypothetical protein